MSQPEWKFLYNLGDVDPITYGGYFIYEDETGVYEPEGELLKEPCEEQWDTENEKWTVYRFPLDKCTYINGILSDNEFHPDHPAWFARHEAEKSGETIHTTYLSNICEFTGYLYEELVELFCSDDPKDRALAYRCVIDYHGPDNLDSYPLTLTRAEVEERYKEEVAR